MGQYMDKRRDTGIDKKRSIKTDIHFYASAPLVLTIDQIVYHC